METYTTREVRAAAGISPEVLDYWSRTQLVSPEPGGVYSARSLSLAITLAQAARLGADGPALASVAGYLSGDVSTWPHDLWLTAQGEVHEDDDAPASIVLHVRRCLAQAGPMLQHALSAA